ncbi:hypothetical protein DTO271D3_7611 [Paecilomyces variotii]|nr:hypothetical protein DTO032I3_5960 [Paecilomyces variotii]KAJ9222794.1 hypothetical protein DTO169C6_4809 [Paecilomyces variotii]KAJ9275203.1 hypothetical protein DTO021D3_7961 [Paecilomyces variotii]KAJ9312169.1 hypothetical protein DTO271D3_7611 [Paecilomyces variotii]KAJ9341349.1 hypothetical protein DTO027B6_6043 [Paecilomyces variotii]
MAKLVEQVDLSNTKAAYYAPVTVSKSSSTLIHISGQPGTSKDGHVPSDYESQIHLALLNLKKLIYAAGASIHHIAKINIYIVNYNPAERKHVRHIQRFLRGHRPATTLVPVQQLALPEWLIEIDAAVAGPSTTLIPAPRMPTSRLHSAEVIDAIVIGGGLSYALAKRFNAELILQNSNGDCVLQGFDGSCSTFPYGELPPFDELTVKDVAAIRDTVQADCLAVDTFQPRDTYLDSLTFEAYLRSKGASKEALATATVWSRAMLGQEPRDISALYFLNYCKSGGGLLQMRSDRKDGGQYLRIRQGTQFLAKELAATLPEGVVRLSTRVKSIRQVVSRAVEVQVSGPDGPRAYISRKAICSVATPVLRTIEFSPPLSLEKKILVDSTTYGYYTKVLLVFKTPFWIAKGFCGLAQSFVGPASLIRDTSSPEDDKHVLTCFLAADFGRAWAQLLAEERQKRLLQQVSTLFNEPESTLQGNLVQALHYDWSTDEFAGWGCPCICMGPGVLDTVGDALRETSGDVHFVGTETAGEWKGYMDGAIRSGERGATEVLADLTKDSARL